MNDSQYEPFGFTEEQFKALLLAHAKKDESMPKGRPSEHFPFKHWEADVLKRAFEKLEDDPEAKGLLASLMEACQMLVLERRAQKALALA